MAEYPISISIRTHGEESFTQEILQIVRGKKNAFQTESTLINQQKPALNTRMQQNN